MLHNMRRQSMHMVQTDTEDDANKRVRRMTDRTLPDLTIDELVNRARRLSRLPPAQQRREIRERFGLSLRDVGRAIGVSHAAVSRWERGTQPRYKYLNDYAELLDRLSTLGVEQHALKQKLTRALGQNGDK